MTMWFPLEKSAAFGEDPARPNEFIWHIPEYDEQGNLVAGDPDYYNNDSPPIGHSGRQGEGIGLNTTIKGGLDQAGPAEYVEHANFDSPGNWGPELAGPLDSSGRPLGGTPYYPYPGPEQLAKDTHFALGAHRAFHWPGGREAAEDNHNGVVGRGFTLENSGSDDEPVPTYRHLQSGHRIEPSGDEDLPWQVDTGDGEPSKFATTGEAAAGHQSILERREQEQERARQELDQRVRHYEQPAREFRPGDDRSYVRGEFGGGGHTNYDYGRSQRYSPSRSGRPRAPRGAPGSRPTNIYDALRHATGTASESTGPESRWDLRNQGTTFGGHPSVVGTNGTGMLNNYVTQQYQQELADGRIQHVIYHHQTPLAWLRNDQDGQQTWVIPDERYSNTSSKRQSAIRRSTGGIRTEEPYDPARGIPRDHIRGAHPDAPYGYLSESYNARDLVDRLGQEGFKRPDHNSRQAAVFIRPTTQTEEEHHPGTSYSWRTTRTHGVYMRPVDGGAWVVGEHEGGTNKISGSKKLKTLDQALAHADRMHAWISGGSQGQPPAIADRELAAYRREIRRPRGPGSAIPRTAPPVLEGQEELPFHEASVYGWSEFLRDGFGE